MRPICTSRRAAWLAGMALWCSSGCSNMTAAISAFAHPAASPGAAAPKDGAAVPPGQGGPLGPPDKGDKQRLSLGGAQPEHPPDIWQRLSYTEDQRKALDLRVRQLNDVIEDRDKALAKATQEVLAAKEEIGRTRAEMERWKKELTRLRDRLRSAEKDNLVTLQSIVGLLEQILDGDKEAAKKMSDLSKPAAEPRTPGE